MSNTSSVIKITFFSLLILQISVADPCLLQPILALERDRLVVNLHPTIPLLIRESKCMAKMDIEIPIVALTLLFRQDYFDTISDSLNVSHLRDMRWCGRRKKLIIMLFHVGGNDGGKNA